MQVLRIQNVEALRNPALVQLLKDAFTSVKGMCPGGFDSATENVFDFIKYPERFAVVAGVNEGDFTTLGVLVFPCENMIMPYPTILLFYNRPHTPKELREAVKKRMMDICMEKGYTILHTANMSGHPDKSWLTCVEGEGIKAVPIGTMFEVRLG